MTDLSKTYIFRMTHIENISHILKNGITHVNSPNANPHFVPIGDSSLISSRSTFVMPNGKVLGGYVPFYLGARMPMLYVIQNGFNGVKPTRAEDIVYCVSSIAEIVNHKLDFVFTDGHAIDSFSGFYDSSDVDNIEQIIDLRAIRSKYWKDENDLDLKRRKEAEFLIAGDVPVTAIVGYGVYNGNAKNRLIAFGVDERQIHIKTGFYF